MSVASNRVIRCWPSMFILATVVLHCLIQVNARPGLLDLEQAKHKKAKKKASDQGLKDVGSALTDQLGETDQILGEQHEQITTIQKNLKKKGKTLPGDIEQELDLEKIKLEKEKEQLKLVQPRGEKEKKKVQKQKEEVLKKEKGLGIMKTLNKENKLTGYLNKKDKKEGLGLSLGDMKLDGKLPVPDVPNQDVVKDEVKSLPIGEILKKKKEERIQKIKAVKSLKVVKNKKVVSASGDDLNLDGVDKKVDGLGVDGVVGDANGQIGGLGITDTVGKHKKGKNARVKKVIPASADNLPLDGVEAKQMLGFLDKQVDGLGVDGVMGDANGEITALGISEKEGKDKKGKNGKDKKKSEESEEKKEEPSDESES